jgi:hypothetical protein
MKTYTRLDKIQKSKGFSTREGICLIVLVPGAVGYIANIVKAVNISIDVGQWGGMEVARAIGMLFPPLGAILGYC